MGICENLFNSGIIDYQQTKIKPPLSTSRKSPNQFHQNRVIALSLGVGVGSESLRSLGVGDVGAGGGVLGVGAVAADQLGAVVDVLAAAVRAVVPVALVVVVVAGNAVLRDAELL